MLTTTDHDGHIRRRSILDCDCLEIFMSFLQYYRNVLSKFKKPGEYAAYDIVRSVPF